MEDRNSGGDASRKLPEMLAHASVAIVAFCVAFVLALFLIFLIASEFVDQYPTPVLLASAALATWISIYVSGRIARTTRGHFGWRLLAISSGPVLIVMFAVLTLTMSRCAVSPGSPIDPPMTSAPPAPAQPFPNFPWPPPAPSAMTRLPVEQLNPQNLGFVADYLQNQLYSRGYDQQAWFAVPDGFALVTRLEQTDETGQPLPGLSRWSVDAMRLREFSIPAILEALFSQPTGYFRVLVFVVTAVPITQDKPVGRDDAIAWLRSGADRLPIQIRSLPYRTEHDCSVLIYEFDLQDRKPSFRSPGRLSAMNHLTAARLLLF